MKKIAVTGGIGSGKSKVVYFLEILLDEKVKFFSVDEIVRELYDEKNFQDILEAKYGTSDRKLLSDIAFSSKTPDFLQGLEALFSDAITTKLDEILTEDENTPAVVVEFPLLFEAGWEDRFNLSILVAADFKVKLDRVLDRDDITKLKALRIMSTQHTDAEKSPKADLIIWNNYDRESLLLESVSDFVETDETLRSLKCQNAE